MTRLFPDERNPREVRAAMHTSYTDYVHGETLYPVFRFESSPESFGRKTVAIATALDREWQRIDTDMAQLGMILEVLPKESPALVIKTVGRHALQCVEITKEDETSRITDRQLAVTFEAIQAVAHRVIAKDKDGWTVTASEGWRDVFEPRIEELGVELPDGSLHGYVAAETGTIVKRNRDGSDMIVVLTSPNLDPLMDAA